MNELNDWEKLIDEENEDGKLTEKQKRIVKAAIETFAEKGYSATSTNEIARKAGVAEGTIFRHYKTKKDLLIAIVAPVMSRLVAPFIIRDLNKVLDKKHETFEAFLRAMIENRKVFIKQNLPLLKILIQEIPFHPELKVLFKKHVAPEPLAKIKQLIKHFQEKGEIIDLPPYTVMRLAASAVAGYVIAQNLLEPEIDWDDDTEMEQTIQFVLRGLKR
ncbi:TetR/AcrR family transcriptional regulator [Scopulibacillus cellulosilyticus]|uniref:TetR/AcrR family transcriptional regulator n=1 Tax=Scopulibacillus cellulosilyticus TaxID=2665665 RepID=A0ABW2PTF9_9BACL